MVMDPQRLKALISLGRYPEQAPAENAIIVDWLTARGHEYDRFEFSVRVGRGQTPNPNNLPGVQFSQTRNTRKRIDVLAWQGQRPTIVEVAVRVTPGKLGQLRAYRLLYLEEFPEIDDAEFLAVGRYSDEDTIRVLQAEGVRVLLYET